MCKCGSVLRITLVLENFRKTPPHIFKKMEKGKNLEQNLDKSNEKLHISDVSCSVCKSCEREICPRCNSRLIKYKVVDVNGKSLNKNSYICTYCSFISDLDVKHYN